MFVSIPMKPCEISFELVSDFNDAKASQVDSELVRSHLETCCESCTNAMALLNRVKPVLSADPLKHAPEAMVRNARDIYRRKQFAGVVETVLARLTFDSRWQSATATGARGVLAEPMVRRLFTSPEYKIDIAEQYTNPREMHVIGQVFTSQSGDVLVPKAAMLLPNAGQMIEAEIEDGEFHFESTPNVPYKIEIRLDEKMLVVPAVNPVEPPSGSD